ncbi:MAG: LssY C-terminal domain-containing protein [Acidobacteria bacterium]|nr:LssY C-terminal domain-containing protein [Acidobacteriota bacterium]
MRLSLILSFTLPLLVSGESRKVEITGAQPWIDTGLDVNAGDLVRFQAEGSLQYSDAQQAASPEGLARGWRDLIRALPLNEVGRGALIGRIGISEAARPFLIGERRESRMLVSGRLFLGLNSAGAAPTGSFQVTFEIIERASTASQTFQGTLPEVTEKEFAQIPRRVVDKDNNPGDRVNFLVLGTEEQVRAALLSAGWVVVDRNVKDTILRGALGTLSRQAYLTMPMSELMVFGRPQDYGFAMSDPVKTVMARHHFRLWKAPFQLDGLTLWVGAGTHDVGFDQDQRTGGVTHKIDPDTDKERDFIGDSLSNSGQVVKTAYVTPPDTITTAKTAHGQEFSSDGRILVIYLKPESGNRAVQFADYFCSVLKQNNPDSADLGPCSKWIETPGKEDLQLGELPSAYRVLVVPGIMNTCVSDNPAYAVGRKVLTEKYGLTTEILSVPNDSSEDNAKAIAAYLEEQWKKDQRPYLIFGYSKGTPDIQVALATVPGVKEKVAAFVSTAGASGGSPIADSLPMQLDAWLGRVKDRAGCKGNLAEGFKSLKKEVRQRFLSSYPHPAVPTYSLAAYTSVDRVPKTAAQTYRMLAAFDKQNDAQLLKLDQIIPESTFLGAVLSDHLNVALNMGATFPRAALLESLVRFVAADLARRGNAPAQSSAPRKTWADGWSK